MQRIFRILKLLTLALGLLLLLAIPIIGIGSTIFTWDGNCYGFTDGQIACPWWEYAAREMFWAMFIFIPFLFTAALLWLAMALVEFAVARWKAYKNKQI